MRLPETRPAIGRSLRQRRNGQPARIIALADRAQERLHRRFWRLTTRGKAPGTVVVAVARELVGFVWAVLGPLHAGLVGAVGY
jgi:hypothetical protein